MAYTTINKSSLFMNTNLYTGTGSNQNITGTGFTTDLIWLKERSHSDYHFLCDSVRGKGSNGHYYNLSSNATGAESNQTSGINTIGSDGFSITTRGEMNENGHTYASWNWKAGSTASGTTGGNGTGKAYSYSVNTTAGFSIIKYTGNATSGHTIPHGLSTAPQMFIIKQLNAVNAWVVSHHEISATPWDDNYLVLNTTAGRAGSYSTTGNVAPTSSVISLGNGGEVNGNNNTYIAYIFTGKQGYSKFSHYLGNANANGNFLYLGFKPSLIILKGNNTENWSMYDNKRLGYNVDNNVLYPNDTSAEGTSDDIDILSNGFKIRRATGLLNDSGVRYIYMAFGQSLVGTNNVPATAR